MKNLNIVRVELVKDWKHPYANLEIENPAHLVKILREFLGKADREIFLTINLSGTNEINSINIVSIGTINHTTAHPREVFKTAILSNAFKIALAHNHPFGKPIPTEADLNITENLVKCGRMLDIQILDHIIITSQEYLSFAEKKIGGL